MPSNPFFQTMDLFVSQGRYNYRIPVIVGDQAGHIVCFANCRMDTVADGAKEVSLVYRYADPSASVWSHGNTLFAEEGWDGAIGTATFDSSSARILLSYYRRSHGGSIREIAGGTGIEAGAFQCVSADGGRTWRHDKLWINPNAMGYIASSHGSSLGITLHSGKHKGRLLVPARFQTKPGEALETLQQYHFNCALYSDDQGRSWQTSGPVQAGTGEGCLVELANGSIYYNSRAYRLDGKRRIARSYDGGETYTDFGVEDQLIEPRGGCNAGIAIYPADLSGGRDIILFCNPASIKRERLTVRISYDGGRTWPGSRVIHAGPCAYSCMAVSPDGIIYVLYENGSEHPYEKITVARMNLDWVMRS